MALLIGPYPPHRRTFARFTVIDSLWNAPLTYSSVLECSWERLARGLAFVLPSAQTLRHPKGERKDICASQSLTTVLHGQLRASKGRSRGPSGSGEFGVDEDNRARSGLG